MTELALQALTFIFERMVSLDADPRASDKSTHGEGVRRFLHILPKQYQDRVYKALQLNEHGDRGIELLFFYCDGTRLSGIAASLDNVNELCRPHVEAWETEMLRTLLNN